MWYLSAYIGYDSLFMWHFNFVDLELPQLYALRARGCSSLDKRDLQTLRCVTYHYHLSSETQWRIREKEALEYISVHRPTLKRPHFLSLGDPPSPPSPVSSEKLSEDSRSPK